jgi:hypothetical protein
MSNESDSEQIVLQESESYPHILPGMKLKKPSKFKLHFLEIKAAYLSLPRLILSRSPKHLRRG